MISPFSRRICIIAIPALFILALSVAVTTLFQSPYQFIVTMSTLGAWFLGCAVAFAMPRDKDGKAQVATQIPAKPAPAIIEPSPPPANADPARKTDAFRREISTGECKRAIDELSRLAGEGVLTKRPMSMLKDVEHNLQNLAGAEASLRRAVRMCEDVTSEVYILSVLANVEVGAHSDSTAGFEVIAKQIQPLAESGAMAAIEAKASLDGAFGQLDEMITGIRDLIKALIVDVERRQMLLAKVGETQRAVERLSDEIRLRG